MPNSSRQALSRDAICQVLAEQLDDAAFARLFPEHDVKTLRRALAAKGQKITNKAAAFQAGIPERIASQIPPGWCSLCTDGASRGNPGHAGAGFVLYGAEKEELLRQACYLGVCTNNAAEYQAVLLGLEEALRHGCTHLVLFLDAELVVRQLQGRYKVKHEQLLPLYQKACAMLAAFADWNAIHVPRADNALADALANQGIDTALTRQAAHGDKTDDAPLTAGPGALSLS